MATGPDRIFNDFETGVSGNTPDGITCDFSPITGTAATLTYDNARAAHGTISVNCTTSTTPATAYLDDRTVVGGDHATKFGSLYFYVTANPAADLDVIAFMRSNTVVARIGIDTAGKLYGKDQAGTKQITGTVAIDTGAWNRIEWNIVHSTASGEIHMRLFKGANLDADITAADETLDKTAIDTAAGFTTVFDGHRIGIVTSVASQTIYIDEVALDYVDYPNLHGVKTYTQLELTSTAADAGVTSGSDTKKLADWTPNASTVSYNKNTAAGPTNPLQLTDSTTVGTDGTAISWYSHRVQAFTMSHAATFFLSGIESATNKNVAPTCQIDRCDSTGAVVSTAIANTVNWAAGEWGTSSLVRTGIATATSTTFSNGDRIKVTLWLDDAANQGGTGNMGSGGNSQFSVNNRTTSISAGPQCTIYLGEYVQEYVDPVAENLFVMSAAVSRAASW